MSKTEQVKDLGGDFKISHDEIPPKFKRIKKLIECLNELPPAKTQLEAYSHISNAILLLEDELWGEDHWDLPRTFLNGEVTQRMYPSLTECCEAVDFYSGVNVFVHTKEFIFISRTGAIEIQKGTGEDERAVPFHTREHAVVYRKPDSYGKGVWDSMHLDNALIAEPEPTRAKLYLNDAKAVVATHGWKAPKKGM